jgi:hypothetical protein
MLCVRVVEGGRSETKTAQGATRIRGGAGGMGYLAGSSFFGYIDSRDVW